ncbi:YmfQ family protein [Burkholderia pseudomallei]|uniref:YmfQ family protein n=1 Tax=Burkholderia pseudomallei TaxID=28450 RepID=UPI000F08AE30|nr:putative phage tail protein [Burkholderia pseudomallei]VBM95027.1 bacteriophage tail protein [Burkholderia pseudomallei]
MLAPTLTGADYLRAFQALMPRGRVWPKDPDAVQTQVFAGLMQIYGRNTARANYLLVDAFPATTYELLPEWEATLGLPDPCAGESPQIQRRRAQIVARLANNGGQSAAHYIGFAAQLGYGITITNYAPFRCGQSTCGQQLGNTDWFFTWSSNATANTIVRFAAGESSAGEPLSSWNNTVLECELNSVKPAHTILLFTYGQTGLLDSTFILDTSSLA